MKRAIVACLVSATTACTTATASTSLRPIDPGLMVGKSSERSTFERRDGSPTQEDPSDARRKQRARTISFWTGIGFVAVGGAGLIAFGATGEAMERKLDEGYNGSLTRADEQRYVDAGEAMNVATIVSGTVALVGLAMASIVYGLDYTHCGTLAKHRKKCRK